MDHSDPWWFRIGQDACQEVGEVQDDRTWAIAIGLAGVLLAALALAVWLTREPTHRDVVVRAPPDAFVALDGAPGRWVDGLWRFGPMPIGTYSLVVAAGPGCDTVACDGWCAGCCARVERPLEVAADWRILEEEVELPPVPGRDAVGLSVTQEPPIPGLAVRLDGVALPEGASGGWEGSALPGAHELEATAGACPATARGCASLGGCPQGCLSLVRRVVVGCDAPPVDVHLGLASPRPPMDPAVLAAPDLDALGALVPPRIAEVARLSLEVDALVQEADDPEVRGCIDGAAAPLRTAQPRIERARVKLTGLVVLASRPSEPGVTRADPVEQGRGLFEVMDAVLAEARSARDDARACLK